MSKIKNGGLDQYGAEPFEQQQFGTAGVEGVKTAVTATHRVVGHRTFSVTKDQRYPAWSTITQSLVTVTARSNSPAPPAQRSDASAAAQHSLAQRAHGQLVRWTHATRD